MGDDVSASSFLLDPVEQLRLIQGDHRLAAEESGEQIGEPLAARAGC